MSLKETPLLGKSGTSRMWRDISSVAASGKLLLQESPSGGKAVDDVRHHEFFELGVDSSEMASLVNSILNLLFVAAAELRVENLLKHRGLALDRSHDSTQVPGLYRELRHLEGHTRDLDVPLCQLSIAAYDADGEQFFDKTCLGFYSVGQLLLSVGPILQDTRGSPPESLPATGMPPSMRFFM